MVVVLPSRRLVPRHNGSPEYCVSVAVAHVNLGALGWPRRCGSHKGRRIADRFVPSLKIAPAGRVIHEVGTFGHRKIPYCAIESGKHFTLAVRRVAMRGPHFLVWIGLPLCPGRSIIQRRSNVDGAHFPRRGTAGKKFAGRVSACIFGRSTTGIFQPGVPR